MPTHDNLWEAFSVESYNLQRFLAYAEKAEAEGHKQVARLLRAAAASERIHARAELRLLGEVRTTEANLASAIEAEAREGNETYVRFLEEARREGNREAEALFEHIVKVERGHQELFESALAALRKGGPVAEAPVCLCTTCGNTVVGSPPEPCPICGRPASQFVLVH